MYQPYETEISQSNLTTVFSQLKEPICLIGGWAVYLTVNKNFSESEGRNYMGSKDIDLGFHVDKKWSDDELKNSVLAKSIKIIEGLGFELLSFRYVKYYHTETRKELTKEESRRIPRHLMFDLNIDPLVDNIHSKMRETFDFNPLDEPYLSLVFDEKKYTLLNDYGGNFMLPHPEVLLSTKLHSVGGRDKEHKRIKDIADIYALLWYSDEKFASLKEKVQKAFGSEKTSNVISNFTEADYTKVSANIGIGKNEISRVINELGN